MKKAIGCVFLAAMLALEAGGCGKNAGDATGASDTQGIQGAWPTIQEGGLGPGGEMDPSAVMALSSSSRDNSMDAYSRTLTAPLRVERPKDVKAEGGSGWALGASRAYFFQKHLYGSFAQSWDELVSVTAEGETGSGRFSNEDQMWFIGPVAGNDHYVAFKMADNGYFLVERDEDNQMLREFPLDFLSGSSSQKVVDSIMEQGGLAADQSGRAHVLWQGKYWIISEIGEVLAEYVPGKSHIRGLVPLYDGRVAFWVTTDEDDGKSSLEWMDVESGRPVRLATVEKNAYCCTLSDEQTLLYADGIGVHRSGLSGEDPERLYRWNNHGIIALDAYAVQMDGEGRISLIYKDFEGVNYLCLEPTTEDVEICTVTLAVPSAGDRLRGDMDDYKWIVAEFNKRYPACHIELTEYSYDDITLLTELTVGKGPVLMKNYYDVFQEYAQLWEPLDTVMEQLGIAEDVLPSVMDMGKIGGTQYGIVTDFNLNTLVTGDPDLRDWDYEAFLQCIEDRQGLEIVFADLNPVDYRVPFIMEFFNNGIDDFYFANGETGRKYFDSDRFRRVLEAAEEYCGYERWAKPGPDSLREGKALCNILSISKPEQVALCRIRYGEEANYIGYPTKDGAVPLMDSSGILSIRRTATKEQKEVAAAFISMCISYEWQSRLVKGWDAHMATVLQLSARRDVLEEQIAAMSETTTAYSRGLGQVMLGSDLNVELDRETLLDMIDKAKPRKNLPKNLEAIMSEELEAYFAGRITKDMLIDHLESRVGLYIGERE